MSEDFPVRVQGCDKCRQHYFDNPMLLHAFASVGMEYGKSVWTMAEEYFDRFHKSKHKITTIPLKDVVLDRKLRFSRKQLYDRTRKLKP